MIDGWVLGRHEADGRSFDTYRRGVGPGVIIVHEIPGLTQRVIGFADEVVAAGYTVVLPHLFGRVGRPGSTAAALAMLPRLCLSREFTAFAIGRTTPLAPWLRSLARDLHAELGGPGVGALGMCFTGGFALAMMVGAPVVAPVLAQPSVPLPLGARRAADLNLTPDDLAEVRRRAAAGCPVLGLRYTEDQAVGTRFETLRRELGDRFEAVELPGAGHSTLTEQRSERAVSRVLDFFERQLR